MTDFKDNLSEHVVQWNTPLDGLLLKYTGTWFDGLATLRIEDALFDAFKTIGLADNRTSQTVKLSLKVFFWVASFEYTLDSAMIVGEYCRYWGMFASENPDLIPHTTLSQERFYLQASYRFSDLFEAATYYSVQYDPENRNSRGFVNGAQSEYGPNIIGEQLLFLDEDLAVSLRFDINYNWLVKLEGHVVDGTAVLYRIDNKDKDINGTILDLLRNQNNAHLLSSGRNGDEIEEEETRRRSNVVQLKARHTHDSPASSSGPVHVGCRTGKRNHDCEERPHH